MIKQYEKKKEIENHCSTLPRPLTRAMPSFKLHLRIVLSSSLNHLPFNPHSQHPQTAVNDVLGVTTALPTPFSLPSITSTSPFFPLQFLIRRTIHLPNSITIVPKLNKLPAYQSHTHAKSTIKHADALTKQSPQTPYAPSSSDSSPTPHAQTRHTYSARIRRQKVRGL